MKKNINKMRHMIKKKINYCFKPKMTIKKICKIIDMDVPKEYKKIQNKKLSDVTRSRLDLKENCAFICKDIKKINMPEEQIKAKSLVIFSEYPVNNCNNIIVSDSFNVYSKILSYMKKKTNPKVITVTGSIGKTSAKDMIKNVLKLKYKTMFISTGNSNSYYKIVKNIRSLSHLNKVYLQEVGLGQDTVAFQECTKLLKSDIAVYTNILDAHIEHYGTREEIAKYKTLLSKNGKKDGLAIINYDDVILRNYKFDQKVLSYSLKDKNATYYSKNIKITADGTDFVIVDNNENNELAVHLDVIGEHHIQNALAAYAVGRYFKIKNSKILSGLKSYKTTGMRQNIISVGDYKVFADCYNSSYDSIETALKTLQILKPEGKGKKIAVLGDVLALGDHSDRIHKNIGKMVAKYDIDLYIFYGDKMKIAHDEYSKNNSNYFYVNDRFKLISLIKNKIKSNDIILFKASHGMHFVEFIDYIFGTDMSDSANIGENDYKKLENKDWEYYTFPYNSTIVGCKSNKKNIKLPDGIDNLFVQKLGNSVFANNDNIVSIKLSKDIAIIGNKAFFNSSLSKIEFNKNLKSIGNSAFSGCSNLKQIDLPNGLISIESLAFSNCNNLTKVVIPNTVKNISKNSFDGSDVIIYAKKGSYAEKYAFENKINFKELK